ANLNENHVHGGRGSQPSLRGTTRWNIEYSYPILTKRLFCGSFVPSLVALRGGTAVTQFRHARARGAGAHRYQPSTGRPASAAASLFSRRQPVEMAALL